MLTHALAAYCAILTAPLDMYSCIDSGTGALLCDTYLVICTLILSIRTALFTPLSPRAAVECIDYNISA